MVLSPRSLYLRASSQAKSTKPRARANRFQAAEMPTLKPVWAVPMLTAVPINSESIRKPIRNAGKWPPPVV